MGFQARVDGNCLERHAAVLFSVDWLKGSHGRAYTDELVCTPLRRSLFQPCYIIS